LPEGVFQLLQGRGSELGAKLLSHSGIDGVVFTGSKKVGMQIMHEFNKDFPKPVFLELGGKNPAIVCAKADLKKAVEGTARSSFGLSGKKCSALSRIFVHESLKNEFVERLIEKTNSLKVGDPLDKDTFVGPVINQTALERYTKAVAEGRRDGKILV